MVINALDLKYVCDLTVGDSFEYVRSTKTIDADGITSVPCERYFEESLTAYKMQDCKISTSPKI